MICPVAPLSGQLGSLSQQDAIGSSRESAIPYIRRLRLSWKMKVIDHSDLQQMQEWPSSNCGLHSGCMSGSSDRPTEGYLLDAILGRCVIHRRRYIDDPNDEDPNPHLQLLKNTKTDYESIAQSRRTPTGMK